MKQPNGTSRITVKKVWQPYKEGDPKGKVVDTDDNKWGVFADKLDLYQEGGTYDIEYDHWHNQRDGKVYHTIVKSSPVGEAPLPMSQQLRPTHTPAPKPNGHIAPRQRTDPTDAERMFVCANLVAFIKVGKVGDSTVDMVGSVNMLRDVWRNTFGADA
jgi:hypothetical protein